ncbi:MAG: carbohydrate ABC transporter permease, partial [Oscillospiraceae bacterium]|nr:carbohydrate ABC transporter permease [Oscillospiraceae bacterium]
MSEIKLTRKERLEEKKYFKEHRQKIKLTPADIVFNIFNYLFFAVFTLSCIFPFYYIFINTISDNALVTKGAITLLPKGLTISNYIQMGKVNDLWSSVGITFIRTILGTALMVFASALAGYLVTKKEMWHRKFWYRFLVITMYFN